MRKRYIFDLDGTVMNGDFSVPNEYLVDTLGENIKPFVGNMGEYLARYERLYNRYTVEDLSRFLSMQTNTLFTPEIIKEWDDLVTRVDNVKEEGIEETLEELKRRKKEIVVLTNWFTESQTARLKKEGLLEYFDTIYGGDIATKPHKQAYWTAAAGKTNEECVFIGDNVDFDYIGPRSCGYASVLYDKDDRFHKSVIKIKKMNEVLRIK